MRLVFKGGLLKRDLVVFNNPNLFLTSFCYTHSYIVHKKCLQIVFISECFSDGSKHSGGSRGGGAQAAYAPP